MHPHTPLRVIRASPRTTPLLGGQEIHVEELTRALASLGVEQTLLFAAGDGSSVPGVANERCPLPLPSANIPRDTVFGAWIAAIRLPDRPDVVHTHGDAPVARGGRTLARRTGAVHVHTFHSRLAAEKVRRAVLSLMLPKRSSYLAVSADVARTIVEGGVPRERIWIRPSGVRAAFLDQPMVERKAMVVAGGRLIPSKGVSHLAERWPDGGDTELRIFGSGPDAPRIAAIAAEKPTVTWMGRLDAPELARLLSEAAVGVVLSREPAARESGEGTPTLVLEMLGSGCWPAVSSETGEAARLVRDLDFGEVTTAIPDPGDLTAIVDRVRRSPPDDRRATVRETMRRRHGWPAVGRAIASFYADLVAVSR